jgi:hypothetical protein
MFNGYTVFPGIAISFPPSSKAHPSSKRAEYQPRTVLQGLFYPNKISGVGTNFGLLIHVFPGPNKRRVF